MNKLKCPSCDSEELKGTENYCPICGENLKEETAFEIQIQKQSDNLYPTHLEFKAPLFSEAVFDDEILNFKSAIKLVVDIENNRFPKQKVSEVINSICQKLLKYYDK